jgi:hypothetical protein
LILLKECELCRALPFINFLPRHLVHNAIPNTPSNVPQNTATIICGTELGCCGSGGGFGGGDKDDDGDKEDEGEGDLVGTGGTGGTGEGTT